MAAQLTGNKAQLANSIAGQNNPMINTPAMQAINPSYNPNLGLGVSGIMGTGNTAGVGGTQTSIYAPTTPSNPIVADATGINDAAKTGASDMLDGLAGKIGMNTNTPGTNTPPAPGGVTPPAGTPPPVDFNAQRNAAFDQYGKAISPTDSGQTQIDATKKQLSDSYNAPTLESSYNALRDSTGVNDTQQRLNDTNSLMRTNQEGMDAAQKQNFSSNGGVTDAGVQQLRAANSRDFITNLNNLSNIRANTVDELNMKNGQIDAIMKLRQTDRTNTQQNLKDKIDMLSNVITPAQKEMMKAKLDATIASVNTREAAAVQQTKDTNTMALQAAYANPDINSKNPQIANIAAQKQIQDQLDYAKTNGIPVQRGIGQIMSDAQAYATANGVSLGKALQDTFVTPLVQKPEYQTAQANTLGKTAIGKYAFSPYGDEYNTTTGIIMNPNVPPTSTTNMNVSGTAMRTDRNNNPTAMTTDVARTAGLVLGKDYVQGDPFTSGGHTYYTAKLLGDPVQTTIQAINNMGFKTQGGQNRWTYTDNIGLNNAKWANMDDTQKAAAVQQMYKQEGGNGSLFSGQGGAATTTSGGNGTTADTTGNNFSDQQIMALRGLIAKQNMGSLNIRSEGVMAKNVTGLTGSAGIEKMQDMLNTFSQTPEYTKNERDTIQNVLDGRQAYNPAMDKQQYILNAIQAKANAAGVNWTPADFKNQNGVKMAFTIGKPANQITDAATALDHLQLFDDYVTAQKNGNIPRITAAENAFKSAFGSDITTGADAIASKLGTELAGAYGSDTVSGIANEAKGVSAALSKGQLDAFVKATKIALGDKMKELNDNQWKATGGYTTDNPQIKKILDQINGNSITPGQGPTASTTLSNGKTFTPTW